MSTFKMPSLGADMESAVLVEWRVKPGDTVTKGQVIAEIEASKGIIEIEVFQDGVVEELLVEPETECKVGSPMAVIKTEGGEAEEETTVEKSKVEKTEEPQPKQEKKPEPIPTAATVSQRIKISPAAKKKAKEMGVDPATLQKEGTIRLQDLKEISKTAEPPHTEPKPKKKESSQDGMRKAIASAMSLSNKEIPHYYLTASINMTNALSYLEELNGERSIKERILPATVIIKASVEALKKVPELNGFWVDGENQTSKEIHPGIAIALRKGGLITPALLDAQNKDLDETMGGLKDLIDRTRAEKLKGSELSKQTITITNLGDLGVESVQGVIYPPQVGLIGFGKILDTPWAEGDTLSVRKVVKATIAGDHRATDGRTGALFLDALDKILQNPKELL